MNLTPRIVHWLGTTRISRENEELLFYCTQLQQNISFSRDIMRVFPEASCEGGQMRSFYKVSHTQQSLNWPFFLENVVSYMDVLSLRSSSLLLSCSCKLMRKLLHKRGHHIIIIISLSDRSTRTGWSLEVTLVFTNMALIPVCVLFLHDDICSNSLAWCENPGAWK